MAEQGRRRGRQFWRNKNKKTNNVKTCIFSDSRDLELDSSTFQEGPYSGWKLYFPEEKFKPDTPIENKLKSSCDFFRNYLSPSLKQDIEEKLYLSIDYKTLVDDKNLNFGWSSLRADLSDNPRNSLDILNLALHHVISEGSVDSALQRRMFYLRILNCEPVVSLKNMKAALYGKLVSVRGTVIRIGCRKLLCTSLCFSCNQCGTKQTIFMKDGVHKAPKKCANADCKSKLFTPSCSAMSVLTRSKSYQIIKIQEILSDDQGEGGRVPRTIECELADDLVDVCTPGDTVSISAIVKVNNTEESLKKQKSGNLFSLYLEGVSLANNKGSSGRSQGTVGIEFSLKDYYAIQEIHDTPNNFRLLVNSLCPSVYGNEMVKAGLLLGLVGGAAAGQAQACNTRGDIHILVVGDPGLGKSHMLHACSLVAPRGVYVCGNTASSSGLTVTLSKESGGDYALEAGALVLANQGICCIDEFDKMSAQHQTLLEAMEQQGVSIAKGGVVCTLPARTSIFAAANPSGGHYNKSRNISENIKISSPLLSRFDLVFILVDKPDEELDSLLSEHIMHLHSNSGRYITKEDLSKTFVYDNSLKGVTEYLSVCLKPRPNENLDLIPQLLLRKYIAYVRKYVPQPKLSEGAIKVLQKYYLGLREQHMRCNSTPVTTRQLESLIRLTQARAKAELREVATESDAQDVVELMKWSIKDSSPSQDNSLNLSRTQERKTSQVSQAKKLYSALQRISAVDRKKLFSLKEISTIASQVGLQTSNVNNFVSSLNLQGFILKKAHDM